MSGLVSGDGDRVSRFRLGEELGSGAVATVVRVYDEQSGRVYAGKILHTRLERDEAAAHRFAGEAQLVRELRHENIVEIHELVEVDGRRVLLMELVEGPTLAELIAREAPLSESRLVALARGIAEGLAAAHGIGIIHRDLKPANILIAHGATPKIADFGMARATSFAGVDQGAMTVVGTPDYMAPETLDPLAVDPRSDLYALGCIMFEMATGRPPYSGATPMGLLEQHHSAPIPTISGAEGSFSPGLQLLITSLLAKGPGDRPQAAHAVALQLGALGRSEGAGRSLARREQDVSRRACVRCQAPLVSSLSVCLRCGFPQVHIEPGPMSLFVVGPGNVAEKFDSVRRERLLQWIRKNPGLGLDATLLTSTIPRLPFMIADGISRASATALVQSLGQLDIECKAGEGGRHSIQEIRKKGLVIAGRRTAVVAGLLMALSTLGLMIGVVVVPSVFGWMFYRATRPFIQVRGADQKALSEGMAKRARKLDTVVPLIEADRHREGLRAVVSRVFALLDGTPASARAEIEGELTRALDVGMLAATRLDTLDRKLVTLDTRGDTGGEVRAILHERDTWSARLLELTATLDALHSRKSAAEAIRDRGRGAANDTLLDELAVRVAALEEVQRV